MKDSLSTGCTSLGIKGVTDSERPPLLVSIPMMDTNSSMARKGIGCNGRKSLLSTRAS